jgi:exodeoxyribonuclease-1
VADTLLWHDYETFGADPRYDRPVQFAAIRTDPDFNPVGDAISVFAKPPRDYLPQPGACLVTGITPQLAEERGVIEAEFAATVYAALAQPGTCALGYNSIRFDDEVTRFTLYRNLRPPYAREWGDGRSRWDLIDAVRTAYALRPDGIEWPRREDGYASFRLEDLTRANGIEHGEAHDALGDVRATLALARLLRDRQPKLYDWLYRHRQKQAVRDLLHAAGDAPLLHVSGRFGAARSNLSLVLPLAWHPANGNELLCADLAIDAQVLLDQDAAGLRRLLYTRQSDLGDGEQRPGLKSVHVNRAPVLLPAAMADEAVCQRAGLDRAACERNRKLLATHEARHPGALRDKLRELMRDSAPPAVSDVDLGLYSGGFQSDQDRRTLDSLLTLSPGELARATPVFEDEHLAELLLRYRARNYPATLSAEERENWEAERFERLTSDDGPGLGLEAYNAEIEARLADPSLLPRDRAILEALQAWGDQLLA